MQQQHTTNKWSLCTYNETNNQISLNHVLYHLIFRKYKEKREKN